MSLAYHEHRDSSAGIFRGAARHLIPPNGLYDAKNGLLDDDALIYKRGGTLALTNAALSANSLRLLWAGYLGAAGERIVYADTADFAVVGSDGATPVNLGLAGLTEPKRAVEIAGGLFIGGGTLYGGSRKTAAYSTGTVGVTQFSKTVTKASGFTANVDVGMLLQIGGSGRFYVVETVNSDTQITLRETYKGATNAATSFSLSPIVTLPAADYKVADYYAAVADRLLAGIDNRVYFSDVAVADPADTSSGQGPHKWGATSYHEFPEGARLIGLWDLGSLALVFTTRGLFTIARLDLDLTDADGNAQQRLEHINPDLILWGNPGIASYRGALVVPATDGVWLVDGISQPQLITHSIPKLYRSYVDAGHKPGLACVIRGHYLLPVLAADNTWVDTLVCRLDRPVGRRSEVRLYPWSRLIGSGGKMSAFAVRVKHPVPDPQLLGAENFASPRVADCSGYFEPAAANKRDRNGDDIEFDIVTRDFTLGTKPTQTKTLEAEYEMEDAATDNPLLSAAYQTGDGEDLVAGGEWDVSDWDQVDWATVSGAAFVPIAGNAPEDPEGDTPYTWKINARAERLRLRLYTSYPVAKLVVKSLVLAVRPNRQP